MRDALLCSSCFCRGVTPVRTFQSLDSDLLPPSYAGSVFLRSQCLSWSQLNEDNACSLAWGGPCQRLLGLLPHWARSPVMRALTRRWPIRVLRSSWSCHPSFARPFDNPRVCCAHVWKTLLTGMPRPAFGLIDLKLPGSRPSSGTVAQVSCVS